MSLTSQSLFAEQPTKSRILVADDQEVIRSHLQGIGPMINCEVFAAQDGLEAWEIFNAVKPDLVILDIYMPKMSGLTLMQKIKAAQPETKVILITGFLTYSQLAAKAGSQADAFFNKPLNIKTLVDAALKLLPRAELKE